MVNLTRLTNVMVYLTISEMSVIVIFLIYTLFVTLRDIRSRFFTILCLILIITDLCTILNALIDGFEYKKDL